MSAIQRRKGQQGEREAVTKRFSPKVMVDGEVVEPEGWMWIAGFALGGCDWAIKIVTSDDFDLRGKIAEYNRRKTKGQQ